MSIMMITHSLFWPPEITIRWSLIYFIQILQPPRSKFNLIHIYANEVAQLQQYHLNFLLKENSIFIFKQTGKLPMQHSVPNQEHRLKWLVQILRLSYLNNFLLFLKYYCSQNNWNNIRSLTEYKDSLWNKSSVWID